MSNAGAFLKLVRHPIKFRLFMLLKLPSAFFCGVRVKSIDSTSATVSVPYKWLSQNPFKSTYFACLAMAAEMSTGLLAMTHTYQRHPTVSMLVTELKATYAKKATTITYFTCNDGATIEAAINEAIASGEATACTACAAGKNAAGELIATFEITWSFKSKKT